MNRRAFLILVILGTLGLVMVAFSGSARNRAYSIYTRLRGRATVEDRLTELNPRVRDLLGAQCDEMGVSYPPSRLVLVVLKHEGVLQVYGPNQADAMQCIAVYRILGASGELGPKLREGDRQVPEGLYRVVSLNPNSQYHLSMELDYPNEFDRQVAAREGRTNLGGDIFIHGSDASVGCLAMGDAAIEELFVLAADVGLDSIEIVIAPLDLRESQLPDHLCGGWRDDLYALLRARLAELPQP